MGKCTRCEKETENCYTYYSGETVSSSSTHSGNTTITRTTYTNLQQHSEYLCAKCVRGGVLALLILSTIMFGGITVAMITGTPEPNNIATWLFGLATLLVLYFAIRNFQGILRDKKSSDWMGATILFNTIQKRYPDKKLFTPDEYKKLTPGNWV